MKRFLTASIFLFALALFAPTALAAPTPNDALTRYAEALERAGMKLDRQGIMFEALDGGPILSHNADKYFNPASVVKLATSATALERLGFDYRYPTDFFTHGTLDPITGELDGDLIVVGSGDPVFTTENAFLVAKGLRERGVKKVNGSLLVRGPFYANFSTNSLASARTLKKALNRQTWNRAIERAWERFRAQNNTPPFQSVPITGNIVPTDTPLVGLTQLFTHRSIPLPKILKQLNNYSNNWMAHVVGSRVGGPNGVESALTSAYGLPQWGVHLQTTSGLGTNDMRPADITALLKTLAPRLSARGLAPADIMPVAGTDPGTLEDRYVAPDLRSCVVAKTGTLRGVSALAGYMYTKDRGVVAFAILNEGGAPYTFRKLQDLLVREMLAACGGPAPIAYSRPVGPGDLARGLIELSSARIPEARLPEPAVATEN